MQQREKILLISLVVTLVGFLGVPVVYRTLFGPIAERNEQLEQLRLAVAHKEERSLELLRAEARLRDRMSRSLPPDPLDAQRLYQQWLTEIAQMSGFANLKVTPAQRTPKAKTYVAIQVTVEGEATLEQLSRFLFHFYRADLLHRVARLDVKSDRTDGDPPLGVVLVAEGLSLTEAPPRGRLFPETRLAAPVTATANRLTVESVAGFPSTGEFRVRIGGEYLTVTGVATDASDSRMTQWTVRRGTDATRPAAHTGDERIELALVCPEFADRPLDEYRSLAAHSPFVKPVKYDPRLIAGNQALVRGRTLRFSVRTSGFNPAQGKPTFRLEDAPEGMTIQATSGEVVWTPRSSQQAGDYEATVVARLPDNDDVQVPPAKFRVTLRDENRPPVLARIASQTVYQGQTLAFTARATDADRPQKLTFRLESDAPAGATIDPQSGAFRWSPASSVVPGDYEVTVTVADNGSPSLTASQKVVVTVAEDVAQFTYLIGAIEQDDDRQAWLYDRANNRRIDLREGNKFTVADVTALVHAIGRDFVVIETDQGRQRLELGRNLRSLEPVPADSPQTARPAESDQ